MLYDCDILYDFIAHNAQVYGKKPALIMGNEKISYAALKDRADRIAHFLATRQIKKGERVALFMRNSPEFVYSVMALSKIGAIVVPINTFLKSNELDYILDDADVVAMITSENNQEVIAKSQVETKCRFILWEGENPQFCAKDHSFSEALSFSPYHRTHDGSKEDTAIIFYTSGTTGKPKGAMISNNNVFSNCDAGRQTIRVSKKDRAIIFLPMFHSFTFSIGVMLPLYIGASIVIIGSIHPVANIFKQTLLKRVTVFFGVPDIYNALAKAKLPWYFMWFNKIRIFVSGAAPLQSKTLNAIAQKFKRATLLEGYGLSEASPAVCINRLEFQKAGSVGPALEGYKMKIVDQHLNELPLGEIGDIIVSGENVMQGYLNRLEATAETIINGWLVTGDMGYMDEDGYLFIVDRKKDLIISKGINIYPRELEEVIDDFEGVGSSAVIGIADDRNGEIPIAYLELEEGVQSIDIGELKRYLKEKLANYKIPKAFYMIDELPKNVTGKVLKRTLKEQLLENK
jgi:long-chain acyl-CoA synthetase